MSNGAALRGTLLIIPNGGLRPVYQKSTCMMQFTLGPYVVQLRSHNTPNCDRYVSNGAALRGALAALHGRPARVQSSEFSVLQKSVSIQTRQLFLYISNSKG